MKKIYNNKLNKVILIVIVIVLIIVIGGYIAYKNIKNDSYIYKKQFLQEDDYERLLNELKRYDHTLEHAKETHDNLIRYNLTIDTNETTNHPVTDILKKYTNTIRHITRNPAIYLANKFPIEYRKYVPGSFMKKHIDTLIYKIPQYECVLTLSNTTDSVTNMDGTPIKAAPNSLMIVKALGVEHEVTQVTRGERKFLKFIFTATDELA